MALVLSGQVTVTGVAQPLAITRVPAKKWVFKAASSNSNAVFIGGSTVTVGNGFQMDAGDDFEIDQTVLQGAVYEVTPGDVYVVSSGTGNVVSWLAFE